MKKMLMVMASAAMLVVPFAGPAAADDSQICEVSVIVHEQPSVDPNPQRPKVETGEYEPYTDCDTDPPIIIHREPICTHKPEICV